MTVVVNLFGGPGTGKSTTAALLFGKLKTAGVNAEMAHEYAKDLTWEDRQRAIRFQPYVAAKQMWRVHRLIGEVDVIVTDSPILFSLIYKGEGVTKSFDQFVLDTFNGWDTENFFLVRNREAHPFNPKGRYQDEDKSVELDHKIKAMLTYEEVPYVSVPVVNASDTIFNYLNENVL
jgi:hypothetical protein